MKYARKAAVLPKQRQLVNTLGLRALEFNTTLYSKLLFDCETTDARSESIQTVEQK